MRLENECRMQSVYRPFVNDLPCSLVTPVLVCKATTVTFVQGHATGILMQVLLSILLPEGGRHQAQRIPRILPTREMGGSGMGGAGGELTVLLLLQRHKCWIIRLL